MTTTPPVGLKLAACPFCGGAPVERAGRQAEGGDVRATFAVACENSACAIKPSVWRGGPWGYRRTGDPPDDQTAKATAQLAWNTRPVPVPAPEVAELDDTLCNIADGLRAWSNDMANGGTSETIWRRAYEFALAVEGAADTLSALSARVGEVEGERDRLRANWGESANQHWDAHERAEAAEARVKALEEALRPFYAAACCLGFGHRDSEQVGLSTRNPLTGRFTLDRYVKFGDFRRASIPFDAALHGAAQAEPLAPPEAGEER